MQRVAETLCDMMQSSKTQEDLVGDKAAQKTEKLLGKYSARIRQQKEENAL